MSRHRQPWEQTPSPWPRQAIGRDLTRDLERDYRAHGTQTIADLRKNEPSNYLKLLLSLMPQHEPTGDDWLSQISNEELEMLLQLARDALAVRLAEEEKSPLASTATPELAR